MLSETPLALRHRRIRYLWEMDFPTASALPWAFVVASYFLGCFNTAFYLVRIKTGHDLRNLGSGNAGARNAGRILGRWGFATALAGDFSKGAIAVLGAGLLNLPDWALFLSALAVTFGHILPVQLGFRGGKGVATALGIACVIIPLPLAAGLSLAIIPTLILRSLKRGGMLAVPFVPGIAWGMGMKGFPLATTICICLLLLLTHLIGRKPGKRE